MSAVRRSLVRSRRILADKKCVCVCALEISRNQISEENVALVVCESLQTWIVSHVHMLFAQIVCAIIGLAMTSQVLRLKLI